MSETGARLAGRGIALAVTGSVAAYKAAMVARLLVKEGADVQPVLSRSAEHFLGAATLAGITGNATLTGMFDPDLGGEVHVDLASDCDLVVIVPATADVIARLAHGRASDVITATALCATCPVLVVPAMHPAMWDHPATSRNVTTLEGDGRVTFVGPVEGEVASGDVGQGRMAEPEDVVEAIVAALAERDLAGVRLVVTAGPTVEDIDPVRFVSNRSSGKMGFALAARAQARGADVTLISGPVSLGTPPGVRRIDVRSALDMQGALSDALGPDQTSADALVMAAAVGDYRSKSTSAEKVKRGAGDLTLELTPNPDLLAALGAARKGARPVLVGFAVETADDRGIVERARKKLAAKKVDLVVANHAADSLGRDDNRVILVTPDDAEPVDPMPKAPLADRILDRLARLLDETAR